MLEYYSYYPITKKHKFSTGNKIRCVSAADIKKQLPESMASRLLPQPNKYSIHCLYVETNKQDIIKEFDEKWLKKGKLGKNREIEVTKDELDNFDYYFTDLKSFDWGKQLFYEIEKPTCSHETCPYGFTVASPTEINDKIIGTFDIARAFSIWDFSVKFLISARAKRLFDDEGFTGLKYSTCGVRHNNKDVSQPHNMEPICYMAEISNSYCKSAESIHLRDYCQEHSFALDFHGINLRYPIDSLSLSDDFYNVDRILVGKKVYRIRPGFFLSRRVLRAIIDNKMNGLKAMTSFIKQGYTPVPFD